MPPIVLDGTTGITTPGLTNTGTETLVNLTTTGNTTLGDASTDTLNVGNGGLIKDASGNVGVGVTPSAWDTFKAFDVNTYASLFASTGSAQLSGNLYYASSAYKYKTTAAASIYVQTAGQHQWYNAPSGTAGTSATVTQAMTLDASGNLGIGTTSPINNSGYGGLSLNGTSGALFSMITNGTESSRIASLGDLTSIQCKASTGYITFVQGVSGGTERARIDSSGRLLVNSSIFGNGCTTTTANLPSNAGVNSINNGSTVAFNFGIPTTTTNSNLGNFFNGNGSVGSITVNGSATSYNTSSDYRLKNITGPLTGAKDFIMALKPKQGTWKVDGSAFVGFLAHEFQEVSPSSVSGEKDAVDEDGKPIMQAMQASSSEVMANLVSFIQEQQAIIQSLTARITALENK